MEGLDKDKEAKRFLEKLTSGPVYYDGDPEQGGKPIERTGSTALYESMKPYRDYLEKQGEALPVPTHNFELLKENRQKKFEEDFSKYDAERRYNGFTDSPADIARFRLLWLQEELTVNVENWLSPTYPNGKIKRVRQASDVVEQNKYKDYILNEIELAKSQIQAPPEQTNSNNETKLPSDKTKRKALQAVNLFNTRIEEIVKQEKGKHNPKPVNKIVAEAIQKYIEFAGEGGRNLGQNQRSLDRYLKITGENKTAIEHARQLVRQLLSRK